VSGRKAPGGGGSGPRRYRIVQAVGKGAFGTVYRAQMTGEGGFTKDVAIKLMNADLESADEVAARQRDEARLLGLIRHRAILQVDGLVRLNGTWAVVMEYIDGANLRQVLKGGPLPPSCALAVVSEVAGALAVAFEATGADGKPLNIVHRDIKPANIQLTGAGEVKLLDFGVARARFDTREAETVGVILGTMRYMAPERLDGIDGPEGDIYALGVVLVELLSRKPMTKTSSNPARHAETVDAALTMVKEALGDGHRDLLLLVEDCLAYEPGRRPAARQLERRAWGIAQDYPVPRLQEWARIRVRETQDQLQAEHAADPLNGETLIEQSGSLAVRLDELSAGSARSTATGTLTVARVGGAIATLALFFTGVAVMALAAALFMVVPSLTRAPDIAPPRAYPIPVIDEGDFDEPVFYRERPGEPAIAAAPGPEPRVEPERPRPAPSQVPAPTAPAPEPADARGVVEVRGDTTAVRFVGADGVFPVPGRVPAGTWDVTYGGVETLKGVRVRSGGTVVLSCSASFSKCTLVQ
jgi:serine/threonine protein kinase